MVLTSSWSSLVRKENLACIFKGTIFNHLLLWWQDINSIGVKIQNLKVDFKTGGTRRWVGQWTLIMNIYDFFIRLSHLVSKRRRINKNLPSSRFLFMRKRFETKRLSRIKTIIHIQYQCPLPNLTPSASSHKINFRILTRAFLQELEFCLMDDLSIWSTPNKNTIYVFLM